MPPASLPTLKVTNRIRHAQDSSGTSQSSRTKSQTSLSSARNKENKEAMEAAIDEWMAHANTMASELAQRFDKKPRYFLDRFFQGGQKFIHKHTVTNPYNAFKSIKSAELRAEGEGKSAIEIQRRFGEEYNALSEEERAQYVADFEATKNNFHVQRLTSRGCIQDVANVARNMESLLDGLKTHVGVEGFFCIVRNNTEFHVNPTWYFTCKELSDYMPMAVGKKWSEASVATKLEAFSIAGCDVINLNRTSLQKAQQLKREISDLIATNIVAITGNTKATMQYSNYECDVVIKHGIELIGWTHTKFCCPSELSNALEPLRTLRDALRNQTCKFVKLSPQDRRAREKKYNEQVASGTIPGKQRKTRKDAGTKRKGSGPEPNVAAKRVRSNDLVDTDDEEPTPAASASITASVDE